MRGKHPKPGQLLVVGYGGVSLIGTLLLMLPWASTQPGTTSFLEAWFTSMSALTVTGLTVVNTATHWSLFGQAIILLLIQIGGLGLMVITTVFLILLGLRVHLGYQVLAAQDQNYFSFANIKSLVRSIILLTFSIELAGTLMLMLTLPNLWQKGIPYGVFFALFHAISAFNGAGFDITGTSLAPYQHLPWVSIIITVLILLGSLGYVVLQELVGFKLRWHHRLSLHSRLVLIVTAGITLIGAAFYFLMEYTGLLSSFPVGTKIVESFFQSATRTCGFTTVPVVSWTEPFQFLMILMMFIGASPGSVGGGIKTTTFAVIVLAVWSLARGRKTVVVMEREIDDNNVLKAFTVTILASIL
ncbi:MAG: Trk family potassium uptake protein, partial [Clostridia bacterium]|nr:Trk family potassium uptake protein [Clostridia bacterium]